MDAQAFLNNLLEDKKRILAIEECIEFLTCRLNKITQSPFSDLPKATTLKDTLDDIAEIQAKKSEKEKLEEKYHYDYKRFVAYTAKLEDLEQTKVLFMKYIDGMSEKELCVELNRSRTKIYNLHKEAIEKLNKITKKEP